MLFAEVVRRVRRAARFVILSIVLGCAAVSSEAAAANVTLAWNPSTDPMVSGYRIYYGLAGATYTNMVDTGPATSVTISNLAPGTTYQFAATTYTIAGIESAFSTGVSYSVPAQSVNQPPPTLDPIADITIKENAGTQTVNLTGISSGSTNTAQTLVVSASSSTPAVVPNPVVNYTSPNATGSIVFAPVANSYGSAIITVSVNNGGASSNITSRTFTVTVLPVNQPPTLNPLANLTINENAASQTINLSGISSGASNEVQTLTVTATSSNPGLIPNPAVTYTSPNTTGTLKFTPVAKASGSATVTVTVNDGGASNNLVSQTFTVGVIPVNQPPTLNPLSNITLNENAPAKTVSLSGIGSGASNEVQTLTVTATSSKPGLIPNPAVTYTSPNSTGSLKFTPVANASGSATVTVTVNDGGASNNIVTRTFTVTVTPVNQPPTLNPLSNLTVTENAPAQTVSLSGISSGASNEVQTLTVTATSSSPGLIPNPAVTYTSPNSTGTLTFTPVTYGSGSAVITVTVNDGGASNNLVSQTFTVTVIPVNQPPTLNPLSNITLNENAPAQTVNLSGISSGASNEVQTLTVTATSSNPGLILNPAVTYTTPNSTGTLTFTPVTYGSGSAVITVTVNDAGASNNLVSQTFTVTIIPVNQPPTLNPLSNITLNENASAQTVNLSGISSGASNEVQTLTVTATSSNPGLIPNPAITYTSPNSTGSLTFTPAASTSGVTTITVTVNDGGASNNIVSRNFTVTVNGVNQPPTLDPIADITITENAGAQTVSLTGITSGSSNEVQVLTVTAFSSNPALIPNPTVNYTNPNTTGSLTFTPLTNSFGSVVMTVMVDDGGTVSNTIIRTFGVTVTAPPSVTNFAIAPYAPFQFAVTPPVTNHDKFSYTLGAGAPAGAGIISTKKSGTFLAWSPSLTQASSTNFITIVITDTSNPAFSTNETVMVVVQDYLGAGVGATSVQSGQSATLPVYLTCSDGVTNVSFTVGWPGANFLNPSLSNLLSGVASSSVQNQGTNLVLSFQAAPGQTFQGSNLMAQLNFQTVSNQPSAFVNLPVVIASGTKPVGTSYANYYPYAGQVAVVNDLALLQISASGSSGLTLTVFGKVGTRYQLQSASNMVPTVVWSPLNTYNQSTVAQTLSLNPTSPWLMYRVQQR